MGVSAKQCRPFVSSFSLLQEIQIFFNYVFMNIGLYKMGVLLF